jgi:L-aspartate oxidase
MRSLPEDHQQRPAEVPNSLFPAISERDIRAIAWNACGVLRNGPELAAALKRLESRSFEPMDQPDRPSFELRNIHQVASLIARAALARQESRGGHYRTDFPCKCLAFEKHSLISHAGDMDAKVTFA